MRSIEPKHLKVQIPNSVDMDNIQNRKVSTSITLDYKNLGYIKDKKINLSEWVNDKISKEFENKEEVIRRFEADIEERKKIIKNLKNEIVEEKKKEQTKMNNLSKEEIEEIRESIKILDERGYSFFGGRYNKYKNLYNQNITREEFEELLKIFNI